MIPSLIDHVRFFHTGSDEDLRNFLTFITTNPKPDKVTLTEQGKTIGKVSINVQNNGNILLMVYTLLNKGLHLVYMNNNLFRVTNLIFTNEQYYQPLVDSIDFKDFKTRLLYGFQNFSQ